MLHIHGVVDRRPHLFRIYFVVTPHYAIGMDGTRHIRLAFFAGILLAPIVLFINDYPHFTPAVMAL